MVCNRTYNNQLCGVSKVGYIHTFASLIGERVTASPHEFWGALQTNPHEAGTLHKRFHQSEPNGLPNDLTHQICPAV